MTDTWILYDDGHTGHHAGYVSRLVDAVQRAGIRPIVASPTLPSTLMDSDDWIEVSTNSLRDVPQNRRQMRRVADVGRRMGGNLFVDLYLDKNVWAAGMLESFGKRLHVLHHAVQYRSDVRSGWAGVRTAIVKRYLKRMTGRGATVLVHTQRAAEIVGEAIGMENIRIVGYPVPVSQPRAVGDPADPPILLFTGAGRSDKGLDILIRSMSLIEHEARLRVVGSQPPGLRQDLDPDESHLITWIDRRVSDEELWEEYAMASLAILPYRQGYGDDGGPSSVLLELLGRGVPIVTTSSLRPQLPPDGRGAIVSESEDPQDLAKAIDVALERLPDLEREAAEAGPTFIANNHTYDRYVEALASAGEALR